MFQEQQKLTCYNSVTVTVTVTVTARSIDKGNDDAEQFVLNCN